MWVLRKQSDYGHQEAGSAEAALQAMTLVKRLLHRVQSGAGRRQALDRRYLVAFGLDGKHQARPDGRAVEKDGAASAHAVLAADMCARQPEIVAQVVRQQPARILRRRVRNAVDLHAANAFWVNTRTR